MSWEDKLVDWIVAVIAVGIIILKICGVITIPWVWILFPIWGFVLLGMCFCLIVLIGLIISRIIERFKKDV